MKQIKNIFNGALELETGEREQFLAEACGDDGNLRREVESLLNSYHRVEDFLQTPATDFSASEMAAQILESEEASAIGKTVGAYRIEREIGRGGMGAVYLATRADGHFRKKVAIKLLRRGTENDAVIRRFQNERQILADLEHPNIARLIDGGVTENGLPYLVMEYVEGLPVNRFCDEQNLSINERLELFRQICAAVEFAQARAIVHRDIKPSNILVTNDGKSKLLDFGIAKTSAQNSNNTLASTATALRVMTPEYASPEQMRGERLTKATDIYSLGVLLYELLTGNRPHNFDRKSPYEIVQAICEEEPIPPSAFSNSAENSTEKRAVKILKRSANDGQKSRLIKSDLDNIVLKSLRKEPERRYASVEEFSEDVRFFLEGSPISARRETIFYRSAKFFKRHRVAALSSFAIALIFLLVGFSLNFFSTRTDGAVETTAEKTSKNADENIPTEKIKGGSANAKARNLYLIGQAFWNQRTELSLKQALDYFQQAINEDPEFALAYSGQSNAYLLLSVWGNVPAKEAFPKAKAASLKALNLAPESVEVHLSLAMVFWLYEYDWQSADREFKTAIRLNPKYARAPHWYGLFLAEMGRFDKAEASAKRALELEPQSVSVNADYGRVLFYARRYDEAVEQYRKTIEMNPNFGAFYSELLELYEAAGRFDEWFALMEKMGNLDNPPIRKTFQASGINEYYRAKSKLYETTEFSGWYNYYTRAEFYAQTGDGDRAFEYLNKAFEVRSHRMAQLNVDPKFDKLRRDQRFTELLKRVKLDN